MCVFFKNEALTNVRLHPINTIKPRKKKSTTPLTKSNAFFPWVNQPFEWIGWISQTHSLVGTCCHLQAILISHFNYFFKYQHFIFKTRHYLCICNCRLNASMSPLSYIKLCKYIWMPLQMQIPGKFSYIYWNKRDYVSFLWVSFLCLPK